MEDSETALEVRITECLWASTFRAADAADLGYSWVCHPDFAMARAFNPEMRLHRDRTLERSFALRRLWGDDSYHAGRSMDVFISRLRKYLQGDPRVEIRTVHGMGFKLLVRNQDS